MSEPEAWMVNATIRYLEKHPGSDVVDIGAAACDDDEADCDALAGDEVAGSEVRQ